MKNRESWIDFALFIFAIIDRLQSFKKLVTSRGFIIGSIVAVFTFVAMFAFYAYQLLQTPNFQINKKATYLYIPEEATFQNVLDSLDKYDIIQDKVSFAFLARLMSYQGNVKPGRYLIHTNANNRQIVSMLRIGAQDPIRLTINSTRLKKDLIRRICVKLQISPEELEKLVQNPEITKKYGFDTTTIACMFLPNTYEVYWNISAEEFLERMSKEYQKFWTEERISKAKKLELNPIEVSVLASIVQAETVKNDEKPKVAGVYINRLEKGIKLQADPTLIFAWQDFSIKRVLNRHKEIESPYNTYMYKGLPPGPINIPSPSSINAVLNYEKHEYIFFCAKPDFSGYHAFAKTLSEHNANARAYQQALNKLDIYR